MHPRNPAADKLIEKTTPGAFTGRAQSIAKQRPRDTVHIYLSLSLLGKFGMQLPIFAQESEPNHLLICEIVGERTAMGGNYWAGRLEVHGLFRGTSTNKLWSISMVLTA
jgi:hypothetical protein